MLAVLRKIMSSTAEISKVRNESSNKNKRQQKEKQAKKVLLDSSSESEDDNIKHKSNKASKVRVNKTSNTTKNASNEDKKVDSGLQINRQYAKEYQERKQREELRNSKDLLNDQDGESDSSSSSDDDDDDENAVLLTTRLDADILRTINALRKKDAQIYKPNVRFFDNHHQDDSDDDESQEETTNAKHKPKRYKDLLREQVLEKMEKDQDVNEADVDSDNSSNHEQADDSKDLKTAAFHNADVLTPKRLAYNKEQEDLRQQFLESTKNKSYHMTTDIDDDSNSDDGLIIVKKKTDADKASDDDSNSGEAKELFEREMKEFEKLVSNRKDQNDIVDPRGEINDGEQFLLKYFKERSWVDKNMLNDDSSDADDEKSNKDDKLRKGAKVEDDDDDNDIDSDDSLVQLDQTDDFEAQYNFRFEQAQIKTAQSGADVSMTRYARGNTIQTLRRPDESRREARALRKERKRQERKAKEEQLKRLKNAKRQEMEEKLRQIKEVLGDAQEVDEDAIMKMLEGDFDPDKLDQLMQETYNEDFYQQEEKEWKSDVDVRDALQKDEDGDILVGDDLDGGLYDNVDENEMTENEDAYQGEEEELDDDYNNEEVYQEDDNANGKYNEIEQKLRSKIQDELYKLDYEDIVAGIPTRFKYREVEPNSYGLSTEEILYARDTTLKQFVSLKKLAPYRDDGELHMNSKKRRKFREMLKKDLEEQGAVKETTTDQFINDETSSAPAKKKNRRLKKKDKKSKAELNKEEVVVTSTNSNSKNDQNEETDENIDGKPSLVAVKDESTQKSSKKRRRRRKSKSTTDNAPSQDEGVVANNKHVHENSLHQNTLPTKSNDENETVDKAASFVQNDNASNTSSISKQKKPKRQKKKPALKGITKTRLAAFGF